MAITQYHSNKFAARTEGGERLEFTADNPLIGIEFECELDSRFNAIASVEQADFGGVQFFAERDGSLDEQAGVEFVSTPMEVAQAMSKEGALAKLTAIIAEHGPRQEKPAVGMHVNVSAIDYEHAWSTAYLGNLLLDFSRNVGGRGDAYSRHTHIPAASYGKSFAVAVRQRSTKGETWECAKTGLVLEIGDTPIEYRNEFRNHRSQPDSILARTQVFYSLMVSRFALANKEELFSVCKYIKTNNKQFGEIESQKLRAKWAAAFIDYVSKEAETNKWAQRVHRAMHGGILTVAVKKAA